DLQPVAFEVHPPAETIAWVERTIGPGARVVACHRLTGGIASLVHELTVDDNGRRRSYVVRRWTAEYERFAAAAVAAETAILTALEPSDIPAPRVVGSTTDAAHAGPAVVMAR